MILALDTTKDDTIISLLNDTGEIFIERSFLLRFSQSEELLARIKQVLAEKSLTIKDISGILVNLGPGKYTGLRVGITTANAIAFSLNIPVAGNRDKLFPLVNKGFEAPVLPKYQNQPVITKPKSRL